MRTLRISRLCAFASLAVCLPVPVALVVRTSQAHAASGSTTTISPNVVSRAMDGTPRLLLGSLTAASPGTAPLTVAERYLVQLRQSSPTWVPQELSEPELIPVGTGHVVRYRQQHHGLPVWGSELVLRISTDGQVERLFRDVVPTDALAKIDPVPKISPQDAQQAVRALGPGQIGEPVLMIDNQNRRLAYLVSRMELSALEHGDYLVDAQSGQVIRRIERLNFLNQFGVYRYNPGTTSNIDQFGIPSGDAGPFAPTGTGARGMTSTLIKGLNCVDDFTTRLPGGGTTKLHLCTPGQSLSNTSGDYNQFLPLIGANDGHCPTLNDANKNSFGEAHMYWHTANIYTRFRTLFGALGIADFKLRISTGATPKPFPLLTNLCMPDLTNAAKATNPNIALSPFENAFYSPGDSGGGYSYFILGVPGDMIAFGMGAKANYSMDADVIYHEFTHAVISTRNRLVGSVGIDNYGLNDDPGAMNEGFADFFSSATTGNSPVGEYAKQNFGLATVGLRDVDNNLHCSNDRVGEVHEDANPWSGALWRARKAVTGDPLDTSATAVQKRQAFDQAVLAAIEGSVMGTTMTEMGTLVVNEVGKLAATLGADASQKTTDAMTTQGVLSLCDRIIRVQTPHKMLCLDSDAKKVWPGHAQWKIDMPASADTVTFDFTTLAAGAVCNNIDPTATSQAPKLQIAQRLDGGPITWNMTGAGTYDKLIDVKQGATNNSWTVTVPLAKSKTFHLMLVNSGGPRVAQNVTMTMSCAAPDGCPVPADADGGVTQVPLTTPTGCGCHVGEASRATSALSLLSVGGLLAALVSRRRRRA